MGARVAAMKDMIRGQLDTLVDGIRASRQTRVNGTSGAIPSQDVKNAVLVTGTTGALGSSYKFQIDCAKVRCPSRLFIEP
jgi:hypothetical protein